MAERVRVPENEPGTVHHTPQKNSRFASRETILFLAGQLSEKARLRREASKAHALVRKQLKLSGVSLRTFDLVEDLAELDDPEAITDFLLEFQHIADAFSVPVGTQMTLFEGAASAVDQIQKAFKLGEALGLMGRNPDDQAYPSNTELGQKHLEGWHSGQAKLKEQFVQHNEKVKAEEADKASAAEAKAKAKAEKKATKAEAKVPKNADGESVQ